jgi:Protein of unknown function (DUF3179)
MAVWKGRNYVRWLPVVLLTIGGVGLFLIPALIIRPFQHQSAAALSLAIAIKWAAPLLTLATLGGVLVLGARRWRWSSWAGRAGLVLAILLSAAAAAMVRVNYFEWMFHPIPAAGFLAATDASLGDAEMVMTVRSGPEARAYPIRQMAYHHVLNDTVGGIPIVVTY